MPNPPENNDEAPVQPRRRSGARRQELIGVAAKLFASRGFYAVTVDDIGEAVGLTGPALYRHFPSKEALLVAVFDEVIEHASRRLHDVLTGSADPNAALREMLRVHVEFAIDQQENLAVWRQEFHNLPEADRSRLRRAQRLYVEEWVHVVAECRPDLTDTEARACVHAVFGLLQSPSDFQSGMPPAVITNLLMSMSLSALQYGSTKPLAETAPGAAIRASAAS